MLMFEIQIYIKYCQLPGPIIPVVSTTVPLVGENESTYIPSGSWTGTQHTTYFHIFTHVYPGTHNNHTPGKTASMNRGLRSRSSRRRGSSTINYPKLVRSSPPTWPTLCINLVSKRASPQTLGINAIILPFLFPSSPPPPFHPYPRSRNVPILHH